MIARTFGATISGIEPLLVTVEADLERGLPKFEIVGLAQTAVREGRNRILSALKSSGFEWRAKKITVNLAPGSIHKDGASLDLPIALSLLGAFGAIPAQWLLETTALGELSLDGSFQPVRGVLVVAEHARERNFKRLVVPHASAFEAAFAKDMEVIAPKNLNELLAHVRGECRVESPKLKFSPPVENALDWSDVGGQTVAKRALEIAAAGHHNILLSGPPGIGKSLLIRRLPTLLPPLEDDDFLEVLRIHSAVGLKAIPSIPMEPPFRAPHHHASLAGILGGGRPFRPGDFSLAHRGVLFFDELPEFRRDVVEALREPLEGGSITVSRSERSFRLPARFLFAGAMNLCPCGMLGDPKQSCLCTPPAVNLYQKRVSGPIRDRIDLWVTLPRPLVSEVLRPSSGETSSTVRSRVISARNIQKSRNGGEWNGCLGAKSLRSVAPLTRDGEKILSNAIEKFSLSARGIHKVIAVARTIADMAGDESVRSGHLVEALSYRSLAGSFFQSPI